MILIDFNFENKAPLKPGSILLSEPFANDEYFSRAVIFICDINDDGSFGFVLNKYIENEIGAKVRDEMLISINDKKMSLLHFFYGKLILFPIYLSL